MQPVNGVMGPSHPGVPEVSAERACTTHGLSEAQPGGRAYLDMEAVTVRPTEHCAVNVHGLGVGTAARCEAAATTVRCPAMSPVFSMPSRTRTASCASMNDRSVVLAVGLPVSSE